MLQNRVDPFGNLIKTTARGSWLGNRGVIHNERQEIIRPFRLKAWITCQLIFKGRKRTVMTANRWTELFFLDEATAFAAGHRPCAECRRADFNQFKLFWLKGNPEYGFDEKTSIKQIDEVIHKERIDKNNDKVTFKASINNLPEGSFVLINNKACLIAKDLVFQWTPFGYDIGVILPGKPIVKVLTPKSVVNAFRAGYLPQMANK